MPTYKLYRVTPDTFISETLPVASLSSGIYNEDGTADWFTPVLNPVLGNLVGYEITAPGVGTYSVTISHLLDGVETILTVELVVVADLYDEVSNCCGDRNIAWYNIQGGWQNYVFSGIKTFQVEAGEDKQFKTNDYVLKHSEISGVFDGEILTTGDIPQSHVTVLDGLKAKSIQAFLYNDETELWDIPILVIRESYTKFRSRDKFFEVRVRFLYAEEILVQTQ